MPSFFPPFYSCLPLLLGPRVKAKLQNVLSQAELIIQDERQNENRGVCVTVLARNKQTRKDGGRGKMRRG